jgi:hypothetical protein
MESAMVGFPETPDVVLIMDEDKVPALIAASLNPFLSRHDSSGSR